jgi:hypothetical protein
VVNPIDIQLFNAAKLSTAVKKFGTASIYLDGTNGYARTVSPVPFGTGNWTIEGWFYPTVVGGFRTAIDYGFGRPLFPAWEWYITVSNTTAGSSPNVWYYVAMVRNGANVTLYVNGVGATVANPNADLGSTNVWFGIRSDGVSQPYTGYIDDIRITLAARYTSNFTPPTTEIVETPNYGLPVLPTAVGNSNLYTIKNTVTSEAAAVLTTSSQTINGSSSFSIPASSAQDFISYNNNWQTV